MKRRLLPSAAAVLTAEKPGPRLAQAAAMAGALCAQAGPACAQSFSSGGISDGNNAIAQIVGVLIMAFGIIALLILAINGLEAIRDERSIKGHLVGGIIGLVLIFGGGWIYTKMGIAGGTTSASVQL